MLYLLLWFESLKQILCHFAPHMDLQKIDEIMFDNSKYNVLKPTIHITRDHFKDFIQQSDNSDFPGRKLFIDRNGIRHYWAGFEARRPKSLRKTILEANYIRHKEVQTLTDNITVTINENKDNQIDEGKKSKIAVTKKPEEIKKRKNKPSRKKRVKEPDDVDKTQISKFALRNDDGKTKVKTTFFCPFFGVITMISHID